MSILPARRRAAVLLALASFCGGRAVAQAKSQITELRVYRGQALITRTVSFDAQAGAQEVTVTDLPEQIVPDSLYATATTT